MQVLLIVYDNESHVHQFPLGTAYIASALREAGHKVTIYSQDVYHYPKEHLARYLKRNHFDVVGLGFVAGYWQYRKMLEISEVVNSVPNKPIYILGGHGPSPEPEYFLRKSGADVVVIGEGEITVINLLGAIEQKLPWDSVRGIAYLDGGRLVLTKPREPINKLDIFPPLPAWSLFPVNHYALLRVPRMESTDRVFPMLTSRGCTFRCSFCYRMDKGLRLRSVDSVIDELQRLKVDYNISYIVFYDELLMSSVERTRELCEAFLRANLKIKWHCNARLNYAKPELLKLMRRAGCVFANYGIEAMDDNVLRLMNKKLTVHQIEAGIKATIEAGITPGFNIIFGNIGDTIETLRKGVEFLCRYGDFSQMITIRPVTPYPGCDLYYHAIKQGLLRDVADFYENKHINSDLLSVNFTELSDDDFHRNLLAANKLLLSYYFHFQLKEQIAMSERLYLEKDASFRGYRQT